MDDDDAGAGTLRDRITRQSEDALGKLAQDLLENPLVTGAISRAFDARERAVSAQETAMSALNLPSAADLERLTRRLRSVSQRLEGIEDGVDRLDRRF
jgi:CRP-like cAMP-binding protein